MIEHYYIEVNSLVKNYDTRKVRVRAIDYANIYVDQDKFIGIMGVHGSGKSTILNPTFGRKILSLYFRTITF